VGYYAEITFSNYRIPAENVDEAYKRFVKLNDYDDAKRGGSFGGEFNAKNPRPSGYSYHPGRWYSWTDPNYPAKCPNAASVLEHLGFTIAFAEDQETIFISGYDDKVGQEDIFLDSIFDLTKGNIIWQGEDEAVWETAAGEHQDLLNKAIAIFKIDSK